ncbi:hypothetical protein HPB52_001247 [Rhipicephalus sanguineus]|uniref:Uncharacterized protein n=1 Tax=Rhipicephalus sanguineus TaxID=34632 RepID=A0A9D4SW06_RHISA|nr:hypothetical protein HPB52_001247 [Rhipicephalus sanguineus]
MAQAIWGCEGLAERSYEGKLAPKDYKNPNAVVRKQLSPQKVALIIGSIIHFKWFHLEKIFAWESTELGRILRMPGNTAGRVNTQNFDVGGVRAWVCSINFGSFGYLVAHEMLRSIMFSGSVIDVDGSLRNWHLRDTSAKFRILVNCFESMLRRTITSELTKRVAVHAEGAEDTAGSCDDAAPKDDEGRKHVSEEEYAEVVVEIVEAVGCQYGGEEADKSALRGPRGGAQGWRRARWGG